MKIAIVDDDAAASVSLAKVLQAEGCVASIYDSWEAFFKGVAADPAACAIVNLRIPGASTLQSLEFPSSGDRNCPIIAFSASDDVLTRERARQLGATAFFRKPVENQALLDAIRWAVGFGQTSRRR